MKLQEMRKLRGLSQSQLSEKSGVNFRTLQNYDGGFRSIESAKLKTLCKLALALDCRLSDIMEDQETIELLNKLK